jgi:hypothetical protein
VGDGGDRAHQSLTTKARIVQGVSGTLILSIVAAHPSSGTQTTVWVLEGVAIVYLATRAAALLALAMLFHHV